MLSVVTDEQGRAGLATDLDELVCEGARRMLAAALEVEVDAYLAAHQELTDERGRRLVRRNGHAEPRQVTTAAGQVEVVRPRVDDRRVDPATGERVQFQSVILPRWCRRRPKVAEVLPLRYLHGLSSMDFVPALEGFFGAAAGLSASVVTRLAAQWQAERQAFLAPGAWRPGLRVLLGGRHPLQPAAGGWSAVLPGHRGRSCRRHQGAGGGGRWRARVGRRVGGAPAGPAPPGHAGAGGHGG
jgi:hypothetical protein